MWILAISLLADCATWTREKPTELALMERARSEMLTATIEWRWHRPAAKIQTHRYVTRVAGDEVWMTALGDEQGARSFEVVNGVDRPKVRPPEHRLLMNDEAWVSQDGDIFADVYSKSTTTDDHDIRSVGLWPGGMLLKDWTQYGQRDGESSPEFCVQRTEAGAVVMMRYASAPDEITRWTLDARFDHQPVRCELLLHGKVHRETRVTYASYGAETFVREAESYSGGQLVSRVSVDQARINDAAMPVTFSPESLGIGNGFNVRIKPGHPRYRENPLMIYCEGELLDPESFLERQRTIGVAPCELFAKKFPHLVDEYHAVLARQAAGSAAPAPGGSKAPIAAVAVLSEWERYTLEFSERFQLNAEQRQKALQILYDCQERAQRHLSRVANELEAVADRAVSSAPVNRQHTNSDVEAQTLAVLQPVRDIFENELKPRLERLPTRAQRAVVDDHNGVPASAPSP